LAQNGYCIAQIDKSGDIIIGDNMTDAFGAENLTESLLFTTINSSEITVHGTICGIKCLMPHILLCYSIL